MNKFINQTILAVDYGTKVTGLATFTVARDPFPMPFGRIDYQNDLQLISELTQLISDECIEIIVLGLPLFTDGTDSDMTKRVRNFGQQLLQLALPIYLQDETLTSYAAQERMKSSPRYNFKVDLKQIDALAASIILEDFISNSNKGLPLE